MTDPSVSPTREQTERVGKWLLRRPADDATSRVFCLPYSGVGASMYAQWPSRVAGVEFCLIQPPGRENRLGEPHYGTFDTMAEQLADAVHPLLDRPFAFFGHCSSALAGFVVNQRLLAMGLPAASRLFISSQVSPDVGPYGRFLRMDDSELRVELKNLVLAMGSQPNEALLDIGLGVMKADIAAHNAYPAIPPTPIPSAITLIGWDRDVEIPPRQMVGWRAYSKDVRSITLQGTHHTFLTAPLGLMAEISCDMTRHLEAS
jgi:surfactin synthase thioesterase subunit